MGRKKAAALRSLYPEIAPYRSGRLDVGDGHVVYWEMCGNPKGKPALFLHGGPGGGCNEKHRRLFDPKKYNIVLFDQRGCGRSAPHACLEANTTPHLVADIEKIRILSGIDRWLVLGGSWGSTLALAYAEAHPKRVSELVLRGVFALRKQEIDWFYNGGAACLFPDRWEKFIGVLSTAERRDVVGAYRRRLNSTNEKRRQEAALAWTAWEKDTLTLLPREDALKGKAKNRFALAFARIENHYFVNGGFLKEGQLIKNAKRLKGIPGVIIQGRYDVVCPAMTAWELHKNWSGSELRIIADAGHAFDEPGILDATLRATDAFSRRR